MRYNPHPSSRLYNIQEHDDGDMDELFDERASLLTATSVTNRSGTPAAASTTTFSHFGDLENDDDDDWEDLTLPTSTLKDRITYWLCWTLPILLYDALRLGLFVLFLAPAFCNFFYYYVTADRQVIGYRPDSHSLRHVVDVYGATSNPKKDSNRKPVLIFLTGGAWVIGYKMWGAFLAKVFAAMGALVVIPDYPNYPFTTVPHMVEDTEAAIQWTLNEIENYGGDPNRIMLAGQSAGGHLASVVLLQKALHILKTGQPCSGFQPTQLAGFCSISAPSDVQAMSTNFQKHGLDQFFVQSLFGVRDNRTVRMDDYDPQRIVEQLERLVEEAGNEESNNSMCLNTSSSASNTPAQATTALNQILPPMSIFHGTGDQTVPFEVSERFATSLHQVGITTEYIEYEGWSHTDPILEAIMDSDHRFHADLYDRLYKWTANKSSSNNSNNTPDNSALAPLLVPQPRTNHNSSLMARHLDDSIPECRRLCPASLIQCARFVNPF